MAHMVKNLPAMQETWIQSLGQEDPLEKGLATHSSIFFFLIYLLLAVVGLTDMRLSLAVVSKVFSSLRCVGFSLWWLLSWPSTGSQAQGFNSCSQQAHWLWCTDLVVAWHVASSQTWYQTNVLCIAKWILNHWTTREAPTPVFLAGEFHGQRSLADYSPRDHKESDPTE